MSLASQLTLYRLRIKAHVGVPDAEVLDALGQAAEESTESAWGQVYDSAMVLLAAAFLEVDVAAGMYPVPSADGSEEICAPAPAVDEQGKPLPRVDPKTTAYYARYEGLLRKRAAGTARLVRAAGCG